jgi:PPIC-type PPIASE domain
MVRPLHTAFLANGKHAEAEDALMTRRFPRFLFSVPVLLALAAPADESAGGPYALINGPTGPVKASLFGPENAALAVAKVEDHSITLGELTQALVELHSTHADGAMGGKKDFAPALDRLIGAQLILIEAHEMGIDELPEITTAMKDFAEQTQREVLKRVVVADVRPDPAEVDRATKEKTQEWKVKSALFAKAEDANAFAKTVADGKPFDAALKDAVAAKQLPADSLGEAPWVSELNHALPQVLDAVRGMPPGWTSSPIMVPTGSIVLKVEETRYRDDPAERRKAEEVSLSAQTSARLKAFLAEQVKLHAKVDEKRLRKLDFEAKKPGIVALRKDKRVLAAIDGAEPITVAVLTREVEIACFHGIDAAIKEKTANSKKQDSYERLLYRRLLNAEAARRKIDQTEVFTRQVAEHKNGLVFGSFVERAVLPGLKVTEEEGRRYYDAHLDEFASAPFYTLQSLSFSNQKSAQSAFDKLKGGTDFKWLKQNAQDQLPEEKRAFDFDGSTLSEGGLTPELAKLLKGSKPGEVRLYSTTEGQYIVRVQKMTAPQQEPYLAVREVLGKKLSREKANHALQEWITKLRKAHQVQIFLTQISS